MGGYHEWKIVTVLRQNSGYERQKFDLKTGKAERRKEERTESEEPKFMITTNG